jgi:cell division septation protein DedD
MPTAQQDTEITLGAGRMLALFFGFVLVCAFFFAIGFSLGRKTAISGSSGLLGSPTIAPSTIVRPSAAKNDAKNDAAEKTPATNDFGFYKAVGEKTADTGLTPAENQASTPSARPQSNAPGESGAAVTPSTNASSGTAAGTVSGATASSGNYYVQVAAVSRQEDAEALVDALKKKQYPAFSANNPAIDKFYHVQVGPYGELKDAESMRTRLISDGYNPIVKK